MNMRNLVIGLSLLVAAQAAAAASYSCTTSTGVSLTYTEVAGPTAPPPPVVIAPPAIGTDPGMGLWIPAGMDSRTVADISGPPGYIVSYVPGCLNGLSSNNSFSGCAANSSFTGSLAGTTGWSRTVLFGSGKQLVLRYRPKPDAGTTNKISLRVKSDNGTTTLPTTVRVWLSTSPTATYDSVSASCKASSSTKAYVITGPAYCQITASAPVYYYGIEYDAPTPYRFQIDQNGSDFY